MRSQLEDGLPCWYFRTEMPVAHGWALSRLAPGGQSPMQSRRKFVLILTSCCVAMSFVVASVLAEELLGVLTKVDVDGKKITVVEKESEKEIEIKVTDETEQVSKNKTGKVDLEKLEAKVKKAKDAGNKVNIKVTHDKNVASKLEFPRGKGAAKKKDN
jgi:hypothetical protein